MIRVERTQRGEEVTFEAEARGETWHLRFHGDELPENPMARVRRTLLDELPADCAAVEVDLAGVRWVGSVFLGMLASFLMRLKDRPGNRGVALRNLHPHVRAKIEEVKLQALLTLEPPPAAPPPP